VRLDRKLALGVEIVGTYGRVRWSLRRHDLETVVRSLRAGPPPAESDPGADLAAGAVLARAVVRTLGPLPFDSRCLAKSLVLTRLLARRGIGSRLVVAVASEPEFGAHAWVESHDTPLLPAGDEGFHRLVSL
jgi:hypothetical protein